MDSYTRKFFFDEIETILDSRPVEETHPVLLFLDDDGMPVMLDTSGNKAIGDIMGVLELIFGYLGKSYIDWQSEGSER